MGRQTIGGMKTQIVNLSLIFVFMQCITILQVSVAVPGSSNTANPFTPVASLIRYWNTHVSFGDDRLSRPSPILLFKASPMSALDAALLARLASLGSLPDHHSQFCSLASLYCSFDMVELAPASSPISADTDFAEYSNKQFSNYGSSRIGGADTFKNYSAGINIPNFSFKKYTKDGSGHSEGFTSYAVDGNVANGSFTNYGPGANGGSSEFKSYDPRVNVPNLRFTGYGSDGDDHGLTFSSYADDTNTGLQNFAGYAKHGNNVPSEFLSYGRNSNTLTSMFTGYDLLGNAGNESFTGYGGSANIPRDEFKTYGEQSHSVTSTFSNYRDGANQGSDSFQSYARNGSSATAMFANYGKSFNPGNDTFKEYGKGSTGDTTIGFMSYGIGRSFKEYVNEGEGVTFAGYSNASTTRRFEPGRFFRESSLKKGSIMTMPDIRDKMPKRPFLPRTVSSKLPFTTPEISTLREIFHAREGSGTDTVILSTLHECERPPTRGETKRCVPSAEDMIDFATSTLGRSIILRTTENVNGSMQDVVIGDVRGINDGAVTRAVSCHQSLYPYLVYYCHSVPKVRVYEAEILEGSDMSRINLGVAICHVDTSEWGRGHGAFVALGHRPGEIEVCHWIFENDMTWTIAD